MTNPIIAKQGWTLFYTIGSVVTRPIAAGETVETSRGELMTITGGNPPHKPGSTGRVYVSEDGSSREYFPSVIGAKWIRDDA